MRTRLLTLAALAVAGCTSDGPAAPGDGLPVIHAYDIAPNAHNVLAAVVTLQISSADSAAVEYGPPGAVAEAVTPAVVPAEDHVTIPVLGLHAETTYELRIVAWGRDVVRSAPLPFSTGPLPEDLPVFAAAGSDPAPGYVVLAAGMYGLVIDNAGRVVWYHRFPNGPGLNFQAQPTGGYTARPPAVDAAPTDWIEIDVLGRVTRNLGCARGLTPRFHDLIALADGSYWIMCDETRTMDLAGVGGEPNARVTATVVQKVGADGTLLFEWSPFDHFQISDLPAAQRAGPLVNWTHGNALALDDGDLIVSFRALSELTKIDTETGAVLWRMGGLAGQFSFTGMAVPAFTGQHSVRVTAPGQLLLLDNLGDPTESRAERYAYDETAMTARLIGSYGSRPAVTALLGGTAQHLSGGHTLVSFGNAARVEEYDPDGKVVWRMEQPGYVFRAQRILSLYAPGVRSSQ